MANLVLFSFAWRSINFLFFQNGIDPSLAEKLLEEASSRAEILRDENVRLRELLIGHLQQTMEVLSDKDLVEQQNCDTGWVN